MLNTLVYTACLGFLVLGAAYGEMLATLASRAIALKFTLHVLLFLEYAAVVVDAIYILMQLIEHPWNNIKRITE